MAYPQVVKKHAAGHEDTLLRLARTRRIRTTRTTTTEKTTTTSSYEKPGLFSLPGPDQVDVVGTLIPLGPFGTFVERGCAYSFQACRDLDPQSLSQEARFMVAHPGDYTHSRKVGILGDLLLRHEGADEFFALVGDPRRYYPLLARLMKRFPLGVLVDLFTAKLPWKPGVVEWSRYLWGACYAAYRERSAQGAVGEAAREEGTGDAAMACVLAGADTCGRVLHAT